MSFDAFIESAWNDHADRTEEVAARLADSLALLESPANIAPYVRLVVHVYGEHLGHWRAGIALLEAIGKMSNRGADALADGALRRGVATLRYAGGASAALDGLSAADRITVLATASSAFLGRGDFGHAISAYAEAIELAATGLPSGSPAIRALAVGGNNLAAALEEKKDRDAAETAGMVAAAEGGLRYWTLSGTWLEEERALYRLARSLLQAGAPERAIRISLRCIEVCSKNDAPALERFFGHAALAVAQRSAGDAHAFDASRKKALESFESVDASEKQWCEAALEELGH